MRRIRGIITVVGLVLLLAGCTTGTAKPTGKPIETGIPTVAEHTSVPTFTATPTATSTPTPEVEVDRSAAFELLSKLNIGWNLGNTMDAHGVRNINAETYWGNPKTTQEMIDGIAEKGFNTIRIPITFAQHIGKAPNYTIDGEWLNRIKELVDYCYKAGLYVIIDTHHEPNYWLVPQKEKRDALCEELAAIWTQLAETFKDYDEHLIFEGMNEPRTKFSAGEWNGGSPSERGTINLMNDAFIAAVRAVGGYNEKRLLIICPYGNSVTSASLRDLRIPADPYIAVAVHMYTPYYFTFDPADGNGYFEWNGDKKSEITGALAQIDRTLLDKGVPVIVTEFGAVHKFKTDEDGVQIDNTGEVLKWLDDYLGLMNERKIKCVWWDNGIYEGNGELFGIYNRETCSFYNDEIADKLVNLGNEGMK